MTGSYEVGLEMKFLNGRLGLDATYYNQNSKNQILSLADVVIAEDGDMLAPGKRLFDAGGSLVHVQKGKRRRERIAAG